MQDGWQRVHLDRPVPPRDDAAHRTSQRTAGDDG
jgi:hypothetical protein